ncbi:SMAD/FHA domain-containing protein [Cladorrhinum samala]|uniref:SMAD/FHA domain-containing protein n=1 Tax=Cladorrhinum samala TaxID=585594 RepID=A0AAV9HV12_9PEZI|nr:SMAD/FHA domain-containing protein [Cladorrhinum samala]
MGDDSTKYVDSTSRRSRYDNDAQDGREDRKRTHRDEDLGARNRRDSSRDREGGKERDKERLHRRRSKSPDSRDRRSRSRERRKRRDRDEHGDRDRGSRRQRSRERDSGKRRSRSRSPEARSSRRHRDYDEGVGRDDRDQRRRHTPDNQPRRLRDEDKGGAKPDNRQSLIKRNGPLPSQDDSFAVSNGEEPPKPVEKPNFGNSGALAAASNSVAQADGTTVTLKYHEPPEARKASPRDEWKLFIFKGQDIVDTIDLNTRSCWLIGRESAVVDLPAEHPSISKQHAVIQFRHTEKRNEFGDKIGRVKPYLIDLESANGTMLNGDKVPESRYLELRNKDMVQFGSSTREYVLMLAPKK